MSNSDVFAAMLGDKTTFRKQFLRYRASLSPKLYADHSERMVKQLQELAAFEQAQTIMVYYPDLQRREVDLRPLIEKWHQAGKTLVLPYITDMKNGMMYAVRFSADEVLKANRWGVLEPVFPQTFPKDRIEAVLAPGLGVDKDGYRLGYGKGFYDRFLKHLAVPVVLATYQDTIVHFLPREIHDRPINLVISEEGAFRIL